VWFGSMVLAVHTGDNHILKVLIPGVFGLFNTINGIINLIADYIKNIPLA